MKIIAFYLPQFHEIPENNKWWGKGFTEWVNVRKAKSLFLGHQQPKTPLRSEYYDLSDVEVMRRQAELAKKYGIYGFCFYHYWFDGKLLLQAPIENYHKEVSIDYPYCICWANENWTTQWVSDKYTTLIAQTYKESDWRRHYEYLRKFFIDFRYMKIDNKPILVIYRPDIIPRIDAMLSQFSIWATEDGFDGLCTMCQRPDSLLSGAANGIGSSFDYLIEYQPLFSFYHLATKSERFKILRRVKSKALLIAEKYLGIYASGLSISRFKKPTLTTYQYDNVWKTIIEMKPICSNSIAGAFVNWDNTPRKGMRGSVVTGSTPEKFKDYMISQIKHVKREYCTDYVFMFAWNEWAEGGYLEPDEEFGYGYLEAVRNALIACGEWQKCDAVAPGK